MDPKLLYECPFTDFDRNGIDVVVRAIRRGSPAASTVGDRAAGEPVINIG
jgi:hypothetical protein